VEETRSGESVEQIFDEETKERMWARLNWNIAIQNLSSSSNKSSEDFEEENLAQYNPDVDIEDLLEGSSSEGE
jgi:hypothetical protein